MRDRQVERDKCREKEVKSETNKLRARQKGGKTDGHARKRQVKRGRQGRDRHTGRREKQVREKRDR